MMVFYDYPEFSRLTQVVIDSVYMYRQSACCETLPRRFSLKLAYCFFTQPDTDLLA